MNAPSFEDRFIFSELVPHPIVILDENEKIIHSNSIFSQIFVPPNVPFDKAVSGLRLLLSNYCNATDDKTEKPENVLKYKIKLKFQDSTDRYFQIRKNVFKSSEHSFFVFVLIEETEKISANQLMSALLDFENTLIVVSRFDGTILEISKQLCKMLDYKREELLTKTITDISSKIQEDTIEQKIAEVRQSDQLVFGSGITTKNGRVIPVQAHSKIIEYQGIKVFLTIVNDLSHEKEKNRKIFEAVIDTEERERKRIAEDLHDGLGPLLSGIKMYINMLNTDNFKPEEKKNMIAYTSELIDEAISTTSALANNLMPNTLRDFGLVISLKNFIKKVNTTKSITISLTQNLKARLERELEVILYRIITELINNTIKHAEAKKVGVKLEYKNGELLINYTDDGKGFDLKKTMKLGKKGLGLSNIISRISSIGGTYKFYNRKNKGIQYIIRFTI